MPKKKGKKKQVNMTHRQKEKKSINKNRPGNNRDDTISHEGL